MTTLRLNTKAAAARRALKVTLAMPEPAIVQQRPATQDAAAPKKAAYRLALNMLEKRLVRMWPHLFSDRRHPPPLAIGIRFAIAPHVSEEEQRILPGLLARWVRRKGYLNALMQPGACRVDLQGNLTPVSPEHAARASSRPPCHP